MKRGVHVVTLCCLLLSLCATALAQVAYPPLLAAEAPLCPGCGVVMAAKDGKSVQAVLSSTEPAQTIMAHFRDTLAGKGWDVTQEMDLGQTKSVAYERGGATLVVGVISQDDGKNMVTMNLDQP